MQTARRSLDAMLAWLALTLIGGCGAHSPYDASWVSSEIAKSAGHDVPVRDVSTEGARVTPSLPPAVANAAALSEDEAVSVALWNSAPFRADLAQLGFARADLDDAAAIPNPNLSFLLPMSTRQVELSVLYPVSTLLQRSWRIASAKYDVERAARSLVQNGLDVIRDVRIAWADLEASERRKKLRERIDRLMRESSAIALRRFESGDTSLLEADLVKAESLAATELAERAAREEKLARVRLRLVLGLAESALGADIGTRTTEPLPTALPALVELERAALGSRPDVRAAEMGIEAASERLGLE
ncbi:MAG: TolC family protein, partial [Polyangiaceae bacterium]